MTDKLPPYNFSMVREKAMMCEIDILRRALNDIHTITDDIEIKVIAMKALNDSDRVFLDAEYRNTLS